MNLDVNCVTFVRRAFSRNVVLLVAAGAVVSLLSLATPAAAQDTLPPIRSVMTGVYTEEQAKRGTDTFAGVCAACHAVSEMTGSAFSKKWVGFPLWDLYGYLAETMPQSDPGSLTPKEYAQVVAYILQLNKIPAGKEELQPDTAGLKRIKVDTVRVDTLSLSLRSLLRKK